MAPGGGWNCKKLPRTKGPTIVHSAYGLRGLVTYQLRKGSAALAQAIENAAEVLLERQVYLKRSNGKPLRPVFTKPSYPYPRLYDFMTGPHIRTQESRCEQALDLLASKVIDRQG